MIIISTETHTVPPLEKRIRLQEYGVGIFDVVLSRSALKKILKKQFIKVDGTIATTATYINGGETIELSIPKIKGDQKKKLIFPLKVLFEDEHIAAIHKPAGILVSGNRFKTITNALQQNIKASSLKDATVPQPVHRLDYATTGVLLIGKTNSSIRELNKMFEDKKISKAYYAVVIGKMEKKGNIDLEIDDKVSLTEFEVIDSVPSMRFSALNLVKLDPKTGRRHQIRKHLSSIENPILGDKEYGSEGLILRGKGLYLHAHSVEFIHPFSKEKTKIIDEIPKRFKKIFGLLDQ